ncbi:MAG: tRNA-uridine aminocarboxypropyltransferase [Pseudomonas sp.]
MNPSKRATCPRCKRPLSGCLCALIPHIELETQIWVIQHPSEQRHALNTARFLVEGLDNAVLWVTECLADHPDLLQQLQDPGWRTELLFPGAGANQLLLATEDSRPRRLVLLDATWRKARKLLHLNPELRALPKVALPPGPPSRYRLRKSPLPDGVSTLEAGVRALQVLEPELDHRALLAPFEALIESQIAAMGEVRYQANYAGRLKLPLDPKLKDR